MKVHRINVAMLIMALIWIAGCSKEAGSYTWERQIGKNTEVVQADAASPDQIAESYESISVQQHESILMEVEDDPKITVYLWGAEGRTEEVKLTEYQISAPADPGRYIYEAFATWPKGEVSYTFVVEVK